MTMFENLVALLSVALVLAAIGGVLLPEPVVRRGIAESIWRTLMNSVYPGASGDEVLMAWDWCAAHKMDPLARPVHLAPIEVKQGDHYVTRVVPMIGIHALRVIAERSGVYLGRSAMRFAETAVDVKGTRVPEWVEADYYRLHRDTGKTLTFTVRTWFREVVALKRDGAPNQRWARAPIQMLCKCNEAAGLRECCPTETGGMHTFEELDGQRAPDAPIIETSDSTPSLVMPEGYEGWLNDLIAVADNGLDAFIAAWKASSLEQRGYLMGTEPDAYERMKERAAAVSAPSSDEAQG